jgi:hypothetical protein
LAGEREITGGGEPFSAEPEKPTNRHNSRISQRNLIFQLVLSCFYFFRSFPATVFSFTKDDCPLLKSPVLVQDKSPASWPSRSGEFASGFRPVSGSQKCCDVTNDFY